MIYFTTYENSELIKYDNYLIKYDEIDSWTKNLIFWSSGYLVQMINEK